MVTKALEQPGRLLVDLSQRETVEFGGNCLEVTGAGGQRFLAVSQRAFDGLTAENRKRIEGAFDGGLIKCEIPFIEYAGGGGIRCMLAGNHLPKE